MMRLCTTILSIAALALAACGDGGDATVGFDLTPMWQQAASTQIDVIRVQGPERKPVTRVRDDTWGQTPRTYAWMSWYLDGNRHTIWPKRISSVEVVYDDEYWRNHTWYRGGKKHWAYDAGYFRPIPDRRSIEWTPNVLDVKIRINGDVAEVQIASCTPNLKEYQMKNIDGPWRRVDEHFVVQLAEDREQRILHSVNLAGVYGPLYRVVIERKSSN